MSVILIVMINTMRIKAKTFRLQKIFLACRYSHFFIFPAFLKDATGNSNKSMLFFRKAAKYAKPGSVSRTIT